MKKVKNVLTFTIHNKWTLHVANFENYTKGCGSWEKCTFMEENTPEEYYQKVLDLENRNRTGPFALKRRNVSYYYWVTKSEVMIDDRSKFGHENQESEEEISQIIPVTYVRGEVFTVAEALKKIETFFIGSRENERTRLIELIYDSPIDMGDLTEKVLSTKIIKIPGEGKRETFFEFFDKDSLLNVFPEEKLVPINMD